MASEETIREICPRCNGEGEIPCPICNPDGKQLSPSGHPIMDICSDCEGEGWMQKKL